MEVKRFLEMMHVAKKKGYKPYFVAWNIGLYADKSIRTQEKMYIEACLILKWWRIKINDLDKDLTWFWIEFDLIFKEIQL